MARLLGRLLRIRPEEWSRLGWLYVMLLLSLTGTTWGETIVEAAFLRQIGIQYLPLVISGAAVLQIAGIGIYSAFADRVADDRLLLAIVGISAAAIAVGLAFLMQGRIVVAYPLLYLTGAVALRFMLSVHWITYVNGFYDTRAAKRILPVLGSAARVAGIIGGLTMPLLTLRLAPPGIISIWLASLVAMIALAWAMPRVLPQPGGGRVRAAASREGALASIRTGYRFVSGSSYLRWLAAATFLMMVLLAYLNYQAGKVMLDELGTVQRIAGFTGLVAGVSNLVVLPFQLFLMSRLIGGIGLGNTALFFPATTAISSLGLLAAPGLGTAALAYLDRTTLRTTIFSAVDGLLYNAVPLRLRGRARAFVSGLVVPLGTLCGGLLLSLYSSLAGRAPAAWPVVWLWPILVVAAVGWYLVSSWFVRRRYAQALVTMLEQDDLAFMMQQQAPDVTATDPATLSYLQGRLAQPGLAPELSVFLAQMLIQAGGPAALASVDQAARAATDGELRARLVAALATADGQDEAIGACLAHFLADPDARVREAALAGLPGRDGDALCQLAEGLLADGDLAVRGQALTTLAVAPGFMGRPDAVARLEQLLASRDPESRAQGYGLLGQIALKSGDDAGLQRLLEAMCEPDDQARLAAATVLEAYAGKRPASSNRIRDAFIPAVHDPVERIRLAAVTTLGASRTPPALPALCQALADPSPAVRAAAGDMLALYGRAALPAVQPFLAASNPGLAATAAVILGRIAPHAYRPLVLGTFVAKDLQAIYRSHGAAAALRPFRSAHRGADLLGALVDEQNQARLAECFYLLTAVCPPAALQTIRQSLASPDRGRRAGAMETLEALTTPQTARLLALWQDPERTDERLQQLAHATWGLSWPGPAEACAGLLAGPPDPWLRAAARYAWRELATAEPALRGALPDDSPGAQEEPMLAAVERILFLREVPFFQSMTVEQLKIVAEACEEEFCPADTRIFGEGDPGGTLYVVVSGRVALEQEKRKGSFARLATIEAGSYFGEMNLFDNSARTTCALAVQDSILLRLGRDPLIALARRYPDLSLALVTVLSVRLREAQDRIAELTRSRPEALHKLYDQLG